MKTAFYRFVATLLAGLVLVGCPSPTPIVQTAETCENLDEAVDDLDLDGSITDFEIPLIWDAHRSDCVVQYRILRGSGTIQTDEIEASDAEELDTTHDTDFLDTVTGPATYSYFIVALTTDDATTPTSEELTVRIEADGSGSILTTSSGSNRYEQALYGSYVYTHTYDEPYSNTEEELYTFFEDAEGTPRLSFQHALADLNTDYYPAGRCVDTTDYGILSEVRFSATHDTLTLYLDGESYDIPYSLTAQGLTLEGSVTLTPLNITAVDLIGCFSPALYVELEYPADTTAHFVVEVDSSLDVVEGNTDDIATILLDYGDGVVDSQSASGASYDFYHDVNPADLPSYYTAIAATAGGLYLRAYGDYTAVCTNHDAYEPNDQASAATTLVVDGVALNLTFTDAADWFSADLSAGVLYRFRTNPTDVYSEMYLYDIDGSTELDYADGIYGAAAAINFTPDATGTYFIRVRAFYEPQCEDYTLVLTTP